MTHLYSMHAILTGGGTAGGGTAAAWKCGSRVNGMHISVRCKFL